MDPNNEEPAIVAFAPSDLLARIAAFFAPFMDGSPLI
jgi:hypothetical protein